MQRPLNQLPPGTRFRQPDLDITGQLLMVNECRALVRIDQLPGRHETGGGRPEEADDPASSSGLPPKASRLTTTSWAPTVVVEALSFEPLMERDTTMPAQKTNSKTTVKAAAPTKPPKPAKADGKLSQLDAALKVLAESGTPMSTKAMIEAMATKGYWTSPGGATPAQTLYSALI